MAGRLAQKRRKRKGEDAKATLNMATNRAARHAMGCLLGNMNPVGIMSLITRPAEICRGSMSGHSP